MVSQVAGPTTGTKIAMRVQSKAPVGVSDFDDRAIEMSAVTSRTNATTTAADHQMSYVEGTSGLTMHHARSAQPSPEAGRSLHFESSVRGAGGLAFGIEDRFTRFSLEHDREPASSFLALRAAATLGVWEECPLLHVDPQVDLLVVLLGCVRQVA